MLNVQCPHTRLDWPAGGSLKSPTALRRSSHHSALAIIACTSCGKIIIIGSMGAGSTGGTDCSHTLYSPIRPTETAAHLPKEGDWTRSKKETNKKKQRASPVLPACLLLLWSRCRQKPCVPGFLVYYRPGQTLRHLLLVTCWQRFVLLFETRYMHPTRREGSFWTSVACQTCRGTCMAETGLTG